MIRRLNAAILKRSIPGVQGLLAKEGSELVGSSPEELATFLRAEVTKNAELIRSAGIKPE